MQCTLMRSKSTNQQIPPMQLRTYQLEHDKITRLCNRLQTADKDMSNVSPADSHIYVAKLLQYLEDVDGIGWVCHI